LCLLAEGFPFIDLVSYSWVSAIGVALALIDSD